MAYGKKCIVCHWHKIHCMTHWFRSHFFPSISISFILTAYCGALLRWHTSLDSSSSLYLCLSVCHVYSAKRQEKRIYLAEMQGCFCSHYFVWCLPRLIWTWKRVKCELEPCCSPPYAQEWHLFRERLYWLSLLKLLRETEKEREKEEISWICPKGLSWPFQLIVFLESYLKV